MYLHFNSVSNKVIEILRLKPIIFRFATDSHQIRFKFAQESHNKFITLEFFYSYLMAFNDYIQIHRSPPLIVF